MSSDDYPEDYFDGYDEDEDYYLSDSEQLPEGGEQPSSRDYTSGCLGFFLRIGIPMLLLSVIHLRYFRPVAEDCSMEVYVVSVERRGAFFKTYEAEIVQPAQVADTEAMYTHPQSVTIANDQLARRLQAVERSGRKVELRYNRFNATLPWRGDSKIVVTGAEIEGE